MMLKLEHFPPEYSVTLRKLILEVCQTQWYEKKSAKCLYHWTFAFFVKLVFPTKLTCYRKYLKNCTVFVWKKCVAQILLADIAKLNGTRKYRRYTLFLRFSARFSKTCVFNKVLRVTKNTRQLTKHLLELVWA